MTRPNDRIVQSLEAIETKVTLLTEFNKEKIHDLQENVREFKSEVLDLLSKQDERIEKLERELTYRQGIFAALAFIGGTILIPVIRTLLKL